MQARRQEEEEASGDREADGESTAELEGSVPTAASDSDQGSLLCETIFSYCIYIALFYFISELTVSLQNATDSEVRLARDQGQYDEPLGSQAEGTDGEDASCAGDFAPAAPMTLAAAILLRLL